MMDAGFTRRQALRAGAIGAAGTYLAACGGSGGGTTGGGGTQGIAFRTWEDHYLPAQLAEMKAKDGLAVKVSFIDDNLTSYQQLKRGAPFDVVSADALWVPKFREDGLIEAFDPERLATWRNLYPEARAVDFWSEGNARTAYPHGWSPHLVYYDVAAVGTPPASWEDLLDERFRGKIAIEKEPNDIMAKAAVATGAAKPYDMTPAELERAKAYLVELKPNILKLPQAGVEVVRTFSEGATVVSAGLGFDLRVKEAGGPEAKGVIPKEGTIAFADGEMVVAGSGKEDAALRFLEADFQPEWIARRFLKYPHPHFDERAYKLLVDQGHGELADRMLYDRPDLPFDETQVALVSPPADQQAYSDAFNEVFGA